MTREILLNSQNLESSAPLPRGSGVLLVVRCEDQRQAVKPEYQKRSSLMIFDFIAIMFLLSKYIQLLKGTHWCPVSKRRKNNIFIPVPMHSFHHSSYPSMHVRSLITEVVSRQVC